MTPSKHALLGERIARHGLVDRPARTPAAAAALTCAVQAQDAAAARLGIRARSDGLTERDVRAAVAERRVVRTWLLRGTIHLVAADDLRWLVSLLGPVIRRKFRTRWRQIGLTDDLLDRSLALIGELLAGGPRTRTEIVSGLADRGLVIDSPDPQAPAHLVVHASTTGLICHATERGRNSTFALTDDWLAAAAPGPRGDEALAELARRFFAAFSPATAADFTAWSGLPSGRAIALIRDDLRAADVDGSPGYRLGDAEPRSGVRLLPAFDNYLIGYRNRDAFIDGDRRGHVYVGGVIRPAVLVDGAVAGTWSLERKTTRLDCTVRPFEPLRAAHLRAVEADLDDVSRFLERPVRLVGIDPW